MIQARRGIPLLVDEEEQAFLSVIGGRLPPEPQHRLDELREKSRDGTLTSAEHAELLAFVQRVERQDVARAQAVGGPGEETRRQGLHVDAESRLVRTGR
jgi:hypothetical protein